MQPTPSSTEPWLRIATRARVAREEDPGQKKIASFHARDSIEKPSSRASETLAEQFSRVSWSENREDNYFTQQFSTCQSMCRMLRVAQPFASSCTTTGSNASGRSIYSFFPIIEPNATGPKYLLSCASDRLSPITKKQPAGTTSDTVGGPDLEETSKAISYDALPMCSRNIFLPSASRMYCRLTS